jgi:AcrR family transcriptional regulator
MPRRKAEEAAKTRQRIIDAALTLFAEHGFANVSTTQISTAAGVTDGALFHHFKSKTALFSIIAEVLLTEIHKEIYRSAANANDPVDAFMIGARKTLEVSLTQRNRRIVFVEGPAILGVEQWQEIDRSMGLRLIEGGLLACAGVEQMPASLLQPMVVLAIGTINEIIYARIRRQKGVDPEQCLQLLMRMLRHWLETDVMTWKATQTKA